MYTPYDFAANEARSKPNCKSLPPKYQEQLDDVFSVWYLRLLPNRRKTRYYRGKNIFRDLGIAVPPQLRDLEEVVSWPAKAVDAVADRSLFNGYKGGSAGALSELEEICADNHLTSGYKMLTPSELQHGTAFMGVYRDLDGDVRISQYSACTAAATWDYAHHRIKTGITIADADKHGNPTAYYMWCSDAMVRFDRIPESEFWSYEIRPMPEDTTPFLVPFRYKPELEQPFGKSRITRGVRTITDNAVRTMVRGEVHEEFYAHVQRYFLGISDDLFSPTIIDEDTGEEVENPDAKTHWEAAIDSIIALTRDENDNLPQVGQFNASSPEPHIAYMRYLATLMAAETDLPVNHFGVIQDNPSSAEAMYASEKQLLRNVKNLNQTSQDALNQVARMALSIAGNKPLSKLTRGEKAVSAYFLDASEPNISMQADAMTKVWATSKGVSKTRWYWEQLGCTSEEIDEIMAAQEEYEAGIAALVPPAASEGGEDDGSTA